MFVLISLRIIYFCTPKGEFGKVDSAGRHLRPYRLPQWMESEMLLDSLEEDIMKNDREDDSNKSPRFSHEQKQSDCSGKHRTSQKRSAEEPATSCNKKARIVDQKQNVKAKTNTQDLPPTTHPQSSLLTRQVMKQLPFSNSAKKKKKKYIRKAPISPFMRYSKKVIQNEYYTQDDLAPTIISSVVYDRMLK